MKALAGLLVSVRPWLCFAALGSRSPRYGTRERHGGPLREQAMRVYRINAARKSAKPING